MKFLVQLRADRVAAPGEPDLAAEALEVVRRSSPTAARRDALGHREPDLPAARRGRRVAGAACRPIIEAAVLLDELGPDLLKLEYPGSPAACRRLAESLTVPWAVLSAGVAFDEFAHVLRISCDEGGRAGSSPAAPSGRRPSVWARSEAQAFLADGAGDGWRSWSRSSTGARAPGRR